jgi:hypothetical protein
MQMRIIKDLPKLFALAPPKAMQRSRVTPCIHSRDRPLFCQALQIGTATQAAVSPLIRALDVTAGREWLPKWRHWRAALAPESERRLDVVRRIGVVS